MLDSDIAQHTESDNGQLPAPDEELQNFAYLRNYLRSGRTPWRHVSNWKREDLCNDGLVAPRDVWERNGMPFPLRAHRFVSRSRYSAILEERFRPKLCQAASNLLRATDRSASAFGVLSAVRWVFAAFLVACMSWFGLHYPISAVVSLNLFITAYFICAIFYRIILVITHEAAPLKIQHGSFDESKAPLITILLPLLDDADALANLSCSIDALEYPRDRMDVKLLLEEGDDATACEASRLGLDSKYDVIIVPSIGPKTKPKACNYGLHLALGDLVVIYDAEDQPEVDQLQKAAAAFQNGNSNLACVQARLNYYNARENWLTRLFTLEYSLWFDWFLPALQQQRAPIPLGGTSNFIRTDILHEIGGWDPYNVTEDADLGLRLSRRGYAIEMIDSTTLEEANCEIGNWLRQRSRWMKGYMQTWLVHMRRPGEFVRTSGWSGLLSVQLFLAGNVISALFFPILWSVFAYWILTRTPIVEQFFPGPLLWLNIFALVVGNLFFILLAVIAPLKRGWIGLSVYGLTAPIYWLLSSCAAYKALWQLFTRPYYWEKTQHNLSVVAQQKRDDALAEKVL